MHYLPVNEVHVWLIKERGSEQDFAHFRSLLNSEELQRFTRFRFEKDQGRFLLTRAGIRTVLSAYCPRIQPEQWSFRKNKYGRPQIDHRFHQLAAPALDFNISHAPGLIAIAVSQNGAPGIDVENTAKPRQQLQVAKRHFSSEEFCALEKLTPAKQQERFFDVWTLKEAYLKACGFGLTMPLQLFSFNFPKAGELAVTFATERDDTPERWQFWQFAVGEDHVLALALVAEAPSDERRVRVYEYFPLQTFMETALPLRRKSRRIYTDS